MSKHKLPVLYDALHWTERREVREQYVEEQKGLCFWCNEPLDGPPPKEIRDLPIDESLFPKGMFKHPVHLQHDHNTGLTEGAVHAVCNAVMWQYHGR